jgi:Domain of unknown function (DUF5666)
MRLRSRLLMLTAAVTVLAAVWVGPAVAATARHVEGRVVSVNRSASSFKLRDSERGTFSVFVSRSTRFEGTTFAKLKAGRSVEATIRRVNGRWQASKVESGSGTHTEPGDDNGGGRGGNDDGPNHR